MENINRENIEELKHKVDEHSEKLAQCRLEEHKADHDTLTRMIEKQTSLYDKVKGMSHTQGILVNQINETAGNLNLIAEKVALLNTDKSARNKYMMSILVGVIISIISGILMIWITYTITSMNNKSFDIRDRQLESIIKQLDTMKQNNSNQKQATTP